MTEDALLRIHGIAARQHGVASRRQLLEAGLSRRAIEHRLNRRHLTPIFRGVYRVGAIESPYSREMAAVLACGPGAVVSHESAGTLWGLRPSRPATTPVDVRGPRTRQSQVGISLRRTRSLDARDIERRSAIPVTSVTRTLLDLATTLDTNQFQRVLAEAERQRLVTRPQLVQFLKRQTGRAGAPVLRGVLATTPEFTRSEAELRFSGLVEQAGLPSPLVNSKVLGLEVDFLWQAQRLVVEVDGFAYHRSRAAFERDRQRDAALVAGGYRVIRVTWRQLEQERERVVARVAMALRRRSDPGPDTPRTHDRAGEPHTVGGKRSPASTPR